MILGKLVKIFISFLFSVLVLSSCSTTKYCKEEVYDGKYFEAVVVVTPDNDQEVGLLRIATAVFGGPRNEDVIMALPCRLSSSLNGGDTVYVQIVKLNNMLYVEEILNEKPNDAMMFNSGSIPSVADVPSFKEGMFNLHKPFEKEGHDDTNHKLGHLNTKVLNFESTGLDQYKGTLEGNPAVLYSTMNLSAHMQQPHRYFGLKEVFVDPNIFGVDKILIIVDVLNTHHHPH